MTTKEDLESFFIRMGVEYDEVAEGMWVIKGPDSSAPIVVHFSPPVVVLRLKVMDLPDDRDAGQLAALYRKLLELNAVDIVHGSYGIEEEDVILSDALELETLDFHELRSSYESMLFAASTHMPRLAEIAPVAHEG